MTSQIDFSDPFTVDKLPYKERRTTVIVTISDTSITPVDIQKLLEAGANVAKFRWAHSTKVDKRTLLSKVAKAKAQCCKKYGVASWPIATSIDLKTCVVKTGLLSERVSSIEIPEDSHIILTSDVSQYDKCNEKQIFVDNSHLTSEVNVGSIINITQEEIILQCTKIIDKKSISCTVIKGGQLSNLQLVTIRGCRHQRSLLSELDYQIIRFASEYEIDMLVVNYVRQVETLKSIKKFIGNKFKRPFLISGICTQQCLDNIDEIAQESDAILLPRDFLPFELDMKYQFKLSKIQKWLGGKCHSYGKPYFVSGGVFQDLMATGEYNDREMADVANALLDGASGFILKSSPNTDFIVEAVQSMNELCRSMEPHLNTNAGFWRVIDELKMPLNAAEASMMACIVAANQVQARVIVIPTVSGTTARVLARMSPNCLIITVTTEIGVTRMLRAFKCVVPLNYTSTHKKNWQQNVEDRVNFAVEYAVKRGWLQYRDMYVTLQRGSEQSSYCDTVRVWTTTISKKALVECSDSDSEEQLNKRKRTNTQI